MNIWSDLNGHVLRQVKVGRMRLINTILSIPKKNYHPIGNKFAKDRAIESADEPFSVTADALLAKSRSQVNTGSDMSNSVDDAQVGIIRPTTSGFGPW